ncbi:cysteine desulfurase [Candidatus Wolfebacteria bacterium]|nr:cysteine desulfurase [Candidatus Wolfebacteria bacterium]
MKKVYLDYAAATPLDPAVFEKMKPYLTSIFGNPSSLHFTGREARAAIEKSRGEIAKILGASLYDGSRIIFTSSGTEANNLALLGIVNAYKKEGRPFCAAPAYAKASAGRQGRHIIISKIEHKSVLESAKKLEKSGFEITYLNADKDGLVKIEELKKALREDTILVSIIYAQNEIGTIQPIMEIAEIIREFRIKNLELRGNKNPQSCPLFHADACQAAGALDLNVKNLGIDLMTLNSSKIYGPKGAGCLYVSAGVKLEPIIVGGGQENHLRAGTENTAAIVGFTEALRLAEKLKSKEVLRLKNLRDYFIKNLRKKIPDLRLNGHPQKRLPNNINISVPGIKGEDMLFILDKSGICVSTGSACSFNDLNPSHVLRALGLSSELISGSLRITLGRKTTKKDVDYALLKLATITKKLRKGQKIISKKS